MIRPRFFRFFSWRYVPYCLAMDGSLPMPMKEKVERPLQYQIGGSGRHWEDVIPFGNQRGGTQCVQLFSEKTVNALTTEGIQGIIFHEAEIVEIGRAMQPSGPCPKYFWAEVTHRIVYDTKIERDDKTHSYIPVEGQSISESDFYYLSPDEGPMYAAVYACSFKVIEACRKHGIENLNFTPIDFKFRGPFFNALKPFRIDLFGRVWPPQWYPEGFPAHPANQIADSNPISNLEPLLIPAPQDYLNRAGGVAARWAGTHPVDQRIANVDSASDWRLQQLNDEDVADIEIELRLVIPNFVRHWLRENPFCEADSQPRALKCHKDFVIHANVEMRRKGYYGREWPENLLYLGDDGGGGAYFVDTTEHRPAVYYYDWESGEGDTVLPVYSERYTPEEFVNEVLDLPMP